MGKNTASFDEKDLGSAIDQANDLSLLVVMLDEKLSDLPQIVAVIEKLSALAGTTEKLQLPGLAEHCRLVESVFSEVLIDGIAKENVESCVEECAKGISNVIEALEQTKNGQPLKVDFKSVAQNIAALMGKASPGGQPQKTPAPKADQSAKATKQPKSQSPAQDAPPQAQPDAKAPLIDEAVSQLDLEREVENFDMLLEDTELFAEFIFEATAHIDTIEQNLLALEKDPDDDDMINDVFRSFHSVKGSAGFLGLTKVNKLSHETETLLDKVRKHKLAISPDLVDIVLEAGDCVKKLLTNVEIQVQMRLKGEEDIEIEPILISPVVQRIKNILGEPFSPEPAESSPLPTRVGEILLEKGDIDEEQLELAVEEQQKPLGQILVDSGATSDKKVKQALKIQKQLRKTVAKGSIRVDIDKIDNLVNLIGELVITNSMVNQNSIIMSLGDEQIAKDLDQLSKNTKEIQEQVMSMRMLPIRQTFQKMERLVHDLSRKLDKKVQVKFSGEDTELDKTIIEDIYDPLVHIVRNSIGHGIENAEEREKAGKPEYGTISFEAYHQGDTIVIEISDDGKGLDREKIRRKAIEKGMIGEHETLSDSRTYALIFEPGFSTNEKVSEVSGRGVGMDVVRGNIEKKLRGKADVSSEPGKGTKMTLRLPLTLGIIDGMIVQAGKEKFIIPTQSICEAFRPTKKDVTTVVGKGEMINIRENLFSLVRLHDLYNIEGCVEDVTQALVILVENGDRRYCMLVDELLGQQQVVIKSLGRHFKHLRGISGASILGDGKVGLILDVGGTLDEFLGKVN